MAFLELDDIAKSFGETVVLRGVSLEVEEGETLVLLGPSGSGKTTLLRLIAGFEQADRGDLVVDGLSMGRLPPAERNFGMVFQHYALFPHLSVGENVAFGLESRGASKEAVRARVEQALERVDLSAYADRRIDAISGGQQQRVALARALAPEPRLLLLDEPLSNLDPELRARTRQELARTLADIGITAVWVTHEQDEAFDVGSRVAVLDQGRLEQTGTPEELYRSPATRFVAGFIGRSTRLRARLEADGLADLGDGSGSPIRMAVSSGPLDPSRVGTEVELFVRPESWDLVPAGADLSADERFRGTAKDRRFTGRENLLRVALDHGPEIEVATEDDVPAGASVVVRFRRNAVGPTAFPVDRETP